MHRIFSASCWAIVSVWRQCSGFLVQICFGCGNQHPVSILTSRTKKVLAVIASHLRKTDGQTQRSICADDVLGAGTLTSAVSDVWSLTRARQSDYPDHFVLECLGKRNSQLGTAWNLEGSQEDFSWVLKSVVDPNDLLPEKRRELKARIVQLLTDAASGLTAQEIAAELGCNAEVARRSCRALALGQLVSKVKAESNGGRPAWLYGVGTFPT